jgi:hypothetical protein
VICEDCAKSLQSCVFYCKVLIFVAWFFTWSFNISVSRIVFIYVYQSSYIPAHILILLFISLRHVFAFFNLHVLHSFSDRLSEKWQKEPCAGVCMCARVWIRVRVVYFWLWYLSRYVGRGYEGKRRDLEETRRDDGGATDKHTANTQVTWASHCRLEISWRFPMGFLATGMWLRKSTSIGTSTNWGSQQVLVPLPMTRDIHTHPHVPAVHAHEHKSASIQIFYWLLLWRRRGWIRRKQTDSRAGWRL